MILVSIVIPVYDVEPWLRDCLDSVINQTYSNLEIILVHSESNDNCGHICDEYAQKDYRIKVIHQGAFGLSFARNEGLKAATGKYIWFIDSDDWVEPNAVELLLQKAENELCEVVMFEFVYEEEGKPDRRWKTKQYYATMQGLELLELSLENGDMNIAVQFKFFRLDFLVSNKLRFVKNLIGEDLMFYTDFLIAAESVSQLSQCLYHYRIRENSLVTTMDIAHSTKICESYYFIFHEFYSMFRREKIPEYVYQCLCKARLPIYAARKQSCNYQKHFEIMRLMVDTGVVEDYSHIVKNKHNLIFYGAGKRTLRLLETTSIRPSVIFDKNASQIKSLEGIPVVVPDFLTAADNQNVVVICLADVDLVNEVKKDFNNSPNVLSVGDYLIWI